MFIQVKTRIGKSYWVVLGLVALALAIAITVIGLRPAQAAYLYSVTDLSAALDSSLQLSGGAQQRRSSDRPTQISTRHSSDEDSCARRS